MNSTFIGRITIAPILAVVMTAGFAFSGTAYESSGPKGHDAFLEEIQKKALDYFLDLQHPKTGLILDRAKNAGETPWDYAPASTATVGFGLTAYVVGAERGWIKRADAYERCLRALKFFRDGMEQRWGFYYHFIGSADGKRMWESELSTIDTVLFLAGALTAGEYFKGTEVDTIAQGLLRRVEWPALLSADKRFFSMGWKPKSGLLVDSWNAYCEHMILYLMAIGSPTHAVPADLWHTWKRPVGEYDGHISIAQGPLFTHQYSHIWIDFRNRHDAYADYFENSRQATLANRAFCVNLKKKYKTYDDDVWGLTACDGPDGYRAYGAPPAQPLHDGTVAPTAAGGSIVFTPDLSIRALRAMREKYGDKIWGKYGFSDAFNAGRNWWAPDVIGIDQGAIMLMIENHRSGLVWELFMRQKWVDRAFAAAGFKPGGKALAESDITMERIRIKSPEDRPKINVREMARLPEADGRLNEWPAYRPGALEWIELDYPGDVENGKRTNAADFSARFSVGRTAAGLAIAVEVMDNDIRNPHSGKDLYLGDLVEIFIDPAGNNLQWGSADDYQIGIAPVSGAAGSGGAGAPDWYAWFQKGRPKGIRVGTAIDSGLYRAEIVLDWASLGVKPAPKRIGLSVAAHDIDADSTPECKMQWFFVEPGIVLGEAILADPETGLLADFDSDKNVNSVGGEFGAWQNDPNDPEQSILVEPVGAPVGVDSSGCVRIRYDVGSSKPAFNGFWMKLNGFNARPYGALSFFARAGTDSPAPNKYKVELKAGGTVAPVYMDRPGAAWKKFVIPKSKFGAISDWSALSEFVIVFEDGTAGAKAGTLYIDHIKFE